VVAGKYVKHSRNLWHRKVLGKMKIGMKIGRGGRRRGGRRADDHHHPASSPTNHETSAGGGLLGGEEEGDRGSRNPS